MYTRCVKTGSAVEPEGAPYNQVSMLQIIIGVVRTFFCFRFVLSLSVCLSVCLSQCLSVLCPEVILCIWRDIKIQELSVCLTSWGDCNWWDVKKNTLSLSVSSWCLSLSHPEVTQLKSKNSLSVSLLSSGDPVDGRLKSKNSVSVHMSLSLVLQWSCWWTIKSRKSLPPLAPASLSPSSPPRLSLQVCVSDAVLLFVCWKQIVFSTAGIQSCVQMHGLAMVLLDAGEIFGSFCFLCKI